MIGEKWRVADQPAEIMRFAAPKHLEFVDARAGPLSRLTRSINSAAADGHIAIMVIKMRTSQQAMGKPQDSKNSGW